LRMTVDQEGNVGIGMTAPVYKLDVDGSIRSNGYLHASEVIVERGSGAFGVSLLTDGSNSPSLTFGSGTYRQSIIKNVDKLIFGNGDANGLSSDMCLSGSGNLGLGTDWPSEKLHVVGNLSVTGQKNAIVPTSQGMTKLYSEESAELWFTDYGKAHLKGGRRLINLDPLFLETVTISEANPMMVFLQEEDECNGLIVKTGDTGFEVIEKSNGRSNAQFSYRVVAKRKHFESARLQTLETAEEGGGK